MLHIQALPAWPDPISPGTYSSSVFSGTPLPPSRPSGVLPNLPGMPTTIRDIAGKVKNVPRLAGYRLEVTR